jgi:predicted MFS family arabinose efflux permease
VSIVSGLGEFAGYSLRAVSGWIADRTGRYWTITIVGYIINMLSVPALALAGNWPTAAGLVVAERTGRAIRRPIVQAMISHAGEQVGRGYAFGLNESLDAAGATIGPLVIAFILGRWGGYRTGFAALLVSAFLCLLTLITTRHAYPNPATLEHSTGDRGPLSRAYWLYLAGAAMIGFGFVDFSLIAFHFNKAGTLSKDWVPIAYAIAMGAGVVANLFIGRLYDKVGSSILILAFLAGSLFAPMVFFGGAVWAVAAMALWGLNKGAQDTLFKAAISGLISAGDAAPHLAFSILDSESHGSPGVLLSGCCTTGRSPRLWSFPLRDNWHRCLCSTGRIGQQG